MAENNNHLSGSLACAVDLDWAQLSPSGSSVGFYMFRCPAVSKPVSSASGCWLADYWGATGPSHMVSCHSRLAWASGNGVRRERGNMGTVALEVKNGILTQCKLQDQSMF